jgi:hypothetical protein
MGNKGCRGHAIEPLEPRRLMSSVADADLFGPGQTVNASSADASTAFAAASVVDGTTGAFRFGNGSVPQRLAVSNFNAAVHTLRFFDTPSYADRAPGSVTIYYSPLKQLALTPASYAPLGTFVLPTDNTGGAAQGDVYRTPTSPADHPRATDPSANPAATVHYAELTGLTIPPGTQSLLLDFGINPAGLGFGLTEIQAFGWESPARPADATLLAWGRNVYQKINASLKVPGSNLYAETASLSGTRSGGSNGFSYVWPESIQFRVLTDLVRLEPATYRPTLRSFADELHTRYWRNGTGAAGGYRSSVSTSSDLFYDDNGHFVVDLAEAYGLTGDKVYLDRAVAAYDFVLSGEDAAGGGGIYFSVPDRTSKDTISTLQAVRSGLMLYQLTGNSRFLNDATRLYAWAASHVQQPNGLFKERFKLTGTNAGTAEGFALINSAGIGLEANLLFYETTGNVAYLREAQRIGRASLGAYFSGAGAINDEGQWAFELVDALGDLYLVDHNPAWRQSARGAMTWLHANREDPNGHYGKLWARDAYTPGTVRPSWDLIDQAPVARSYLHTAWVDTVAPPFVTSAASSVGGFWQASPGGNATASTAGPAAGQYPATQAPAMAVDGNTATKYLNFGNAGAASATKGVGTGFYVTPANGPTIVTGIQVATANDFPNRDPLTVSIEGTNATGNFNSGATWTLIADNVNLGIDVDPGRQTFGPVVRFANTTPYASYRVIVRSQRGVDSAVQYAEMNLVGARDVAADHAVVGRYVSHDDGGTAADKLALRPGDAPTFANRTSSASGINAVMVDIVGASDAFRTAPSVTDFVFETPAAGLTDSWIAAAAPAGVDIRRAGGAGGSDRVIFVWEDAAAVRSSWLRVTVLSNPRTGLARPDVFSFGNLIGDTGGASVVDAADVAATRANLGRTSPAALAASDFNHDGRVNALDLAIVRRNFGRSLPSPSSPAVVSIASTFSELAVPLAITRTAPARRSLLDEPQPPLLV